MERRPICENRHWACFRARAVVTNDIRQLARSRQTLKAKARGAIAYWHRSESLKDRPIHREMANYELP